MKTITSLASILCILVFHVPAVTQVVGDTFDMFVDAPGQPCTTWSQIKTCYGDKPDPCCKFTKDIYVDGYIIVYFSANEYRVFKCPEDYKVGAMGGCALIAGKSQTSLENKSWGTIKALF